MRIRTLTALSALGLFVAAAAWALHQQIDYVFASLACRNGIPMMWVVTVLVILLVAAASAVAMRLPRDDTAGEPDPSDILRPRKFLNSISLLALLLFLFAIFLQAAATLFLPSCAG